MIIWQFLDDTEILEAEHGEDIVTTPTTLGKIL